MADLKKASREMHYQTYLVSCWQEQDETTGKTSWRFRLEIPKTGEQHMQTTLKDVMAVIEEARTAKKEGCAALGVVPLRNGKIISAAHNMTDLNGDSHSSLDVIHKLGRDEDLRDTIMDDGSQNTVF